MVFALRDSYIVMSDFLQVTGLAKTTPWLLAAGTTMRLKNRDTGRPATHPTLTTFTTGPLGKIAASLYIFWEKHCA